MVSPVSALGGGGGGRGFTERKWLNPDRALFVFFGKNRDHFFSSFIFRDQADIFNSSSFLLSTGVSYSNVLGKARAHDLTCFVPESPESLLWPVCATTDPSGLEALDLLATPQPNSCPPQPHLSYGEEQ